MVTVKQARYALFGLILTGVAQSVLAVGLMPVPVFNSAQISTSTIHDPAAGQFTDEGHFFYHYTVHNPAENTGDIWTFAIDVSTDGFYTSWHSASDLTILYGGKTYSFIEMYYERSNLIAPGENIVPFGQILPQRWAGGFGRNLSASFSVLNAQQLIKPGTVRDGFTLYSPMPPSIRQARITPNWVFVVEDHGAITAEQQAEADSVLQNLHVLTHVLGPARGINFGAFTHWRQVGNDIKLAAEIGWFPDIAVATQVQTMFFEARDARNRSDGTLAKQILQDVLDLLSTLSADQIVTEARDLLGINLPLLIKYTPDTTYPVDPELIVQHCGDSFTLGYQCEIVVRMIDIAHNNAPLPNWYVSLYITDGPNMGLFRSGRTDALGEVKLGFTSNEVGIDDIRLMAIQGEGDEFEKALVVEWTEGADLLIGHLGPREIETKGGRKITLLESTFNLGRLDAGHSTTRFYISDKAVFDKTDATIIGHRQIDPLPAETAMEPVETVVQIPAGLPQGHYYLTACADSDSQVIENDETNNCSDVQLDNVISVAVTAASLNAPPDCNEAYPDNPVLWPPNHKFKSVNIMGVTDPDDDPITISISGIHQDEPVNELGDGDTAPDGQGIGTPVADVRAERSGTGSGRVYTVSFDAEDANGGSCSGVVKIKVPHDQASVEAVIDEGSVYDSTSLQ